MSAFLQFRPFWRGYVRLVVAAWGLAAGCPGTVPAAEAADDSIEPLAVLHRTCVRCHTEDKRKGGLLMTTREGLLEGGETGPALLPGRSAESFLTETLFPDADPHMPPKGQLNPREMIALEEWIDAGAPWDDALWAKLQNAADIRPVALTGLPPAYHPIMAVAVSPDGATVAAGRGGEIAFFELAATADEKSPPSLKAAGAIDAGRDAVQALAWAPDGKTLAAGGFRRVLLIDTATRQVRTEIRTDLAGRITALAFSNDSKTLFAADSIPAAAGRLHFIGAASGKIDASLRAHGDTIFDLDVSPDGKMLASASADKLVRIWDLATRERVTTLEGHTGYVLACAFSPESGRLASAGDDEVIKIWNLGTAKQEAAFGDTGVSAGPITGLAWTTDPANAEKKAAEKDAEKAKAINTDRLVAVNEAGKPKIYNELKDHEGEQRSTGAREKAAEEAGDLLTAVALDPKSQRFFAGSATGLIRMWSADGKLIATLPEPAKIAEAPTNP